LIPFISTINSKGLIPVLGSQLVSHRNHKPGGTAVTFRHARDYLPGRRASSPFGGYHIILLGDRDTSVWTTRPESFHSNGSTGSRTRDG